MQCQGYAPFTVSPAQDRVLDAALERSGPGRVAVLDLDGCLFDNRPRQVAIFHEYAARRGVLALHAVGLQHFQDWNQRRTLANAGLPPQLVDEIHQDLREFWWERFFSSTYVRLDHPLPGAVRLARQLHDAGTHVVYLTGRDRSMHPGTVATLQRYGFPDPEDQRVSLLTKPSPETSDEDWKSLALPRVEGLGQPVLCMDNEPTNCNLFHKAYPAALVVFVSTDHSSRPVQPHPSLPWIRGFLRTSDSIPGLIPAEADGAD